MCLAQATRIWAERSELSFCKCKKQQTEENLRLLRAPQRREAPLHELRATRDAPRLRESNKTQRHRLQATPPVALDHNLDRAPGFWLSGAGAPFRISAIGLDTAPPGR